MFKKILIANRGEIACRIAHTARRLAVQTVAIYSDVDAQSTHVNACDEAIHLGGNEPKNSYLRWEKIIAAARVTGAQAIHPGYGFLSENAEFAQACFDAGLVFIGPGVSAIRAMGLKAESKRLMSKANVPLVPGYHAADQNLALLQQEALRIGFPILIKASAGGGGKGMRIVENPADFESALLSCQREAKSSFNNDQVLLEKYIERPRHVEVQIFADQQGQCVYLFDRDCSVQRRHQKIIEEAPAPNLPPLLRKKMGEAAVAAAQAVNYVGAGTVEFILEQGARGTLDFFFMEMNTRLQVEHPVTEAITGQDLVEWQLRVASGEPLPLKQDQIKQNGHAIEARICAENPEENFLPATGSLHVFRHPKASHFELIANNHVRLDTGVQSRDKISPYYDSMIAKLIAFGSSREQALARLDCALAQTHIVGVQNNVQFLRQVLQTTSFAQANLDTHLIEREKAVLFGQDQIGLSLSVAAAISHILKSEQESATCDPFSKRDGWTLSGSSQRLFEFEYQNRRVFVQLSYLREGRLHLQVDSVASPLTWRAQNESLSLTWLQQHTLLRVDRLNHDFFIFTSQGRSQIKWIDALSHAGIDDHHQGRLTSPMPGKLLSFLVRAGDSIEKGQNLAVIEAMKMEHTIVAPRSGIVQELLYRAGDQVNEGAELLRLVSISE